MRIRNDLEGVVYVHVGGDVVSLAAGDVVPDGALVGNHLAEEAPEAEEPAVVLQPEETETQAEEPATVPELEETENAGSRRRRRSTTRPAADDA